MNEANEKKKPGERLQAYLRNKGQKQGDFADRIDVVDSMVSRFIHGQARPGLDTAFNIERETGGAIDAEEWTRRGLVNVVGDQQISGAT